MLLNPYRFGAPPPASAKWDSTYNIFGMEYLSGDLQIKPKNASAQNARSTQPLTGKVYFEVKIDVTSAFALAHCVGVAGVMGGQVTIGNSANSWGYFSGGGYRHNSATVASQFPYGANDIIMVAVDADAGYLWFGINGTWYGANPATGGGAAMTGLSGTLYAAASMEGSSILTSTARFAAADWTYSAPAGFSPL